MPTFEIVEEDGTQCIDYDETPGNIIITAGSGSGKDILGEMIIYNEYKRGHTVIILTDVKDEYESGYLQFEPKEDYHRKKCEKWGVPIEGIPTKIYHPYTFKIPRKPIPKIEFYTIPIKSLTRDELSYMAESIEDKMSIRIMTDVLNKMRGNEGLHHLQYYAENQISPSTIRKRNTNAEEFFAKGSQGGTQKTASEIISYLKPYLTDYNLTPENCKYNIDYKKLINDNTQYHFLTLKYIEDPKQKKFYILQFINGIIKNIKDHAKHPVTLYIPEIRIICPGVTTGHTTILSKVLTEKLSTNRNIGKGITTIMNTQVYSDVADEITKSATNLIIGKTSAVKDIDAIAKAQRLTTPQVNYIKGLNTGQFIINKIKRGKYEQDGYDQPITAFMSGQRHAEVKYNYQETITKEKPEDIQDYKEQTEYMKELKQTIAKDIQDKVEKENAQKEAEEKRKEEQKQENKKPIDTSKKKLEQVNNNLKELVRIKWNKYKEEGRNKSYSDIAKEFNLYDSKGKPEKMKIKRIIEQETKGENNEQQSTST